MRWTAHMNCPRADLRLALLLALALSAVTSCATNPVTGKRELNLVSMNQELAIGKEGYGAVLSEYGAYDDPRLQAYVDSVGHALARVSHRPDLDWKFTVLDDPTVNAFAMPGGYVYVTRGILAHLNSEAQLAGVLGHEIGHVTARHSAKQLTQQTLAGIGLGVASFVSPAVQRYSGAAQQALQLVFLKYSRDDETQADELGVEYATKAGWDPREIPATYAMVKRVSDQAGQKLPGFLSTHPDPGNREVRTAELARVAAAGKTGLRIGGRSHLTRLDGVVFGNDPRQGFFEGEHFYHPQLGFQMTFPAGWKTQNTKSAVTAAEPNQKATVQLTAENAGAMSPGEYFASLQASGKISAAEGGNETIGGFTAWIGRIRVPQSDGSAAVMTAAGIRKSGDQFFRLLGQSAAPGDADDAAIVATARSFRPLTDPARLGVTPARVKVVAAPRNGTFRDVVSALGSNGAPLDAVAILNNAELDGAVNQGELLKIVVAGRR